MQTRFLGDSDLKITSIGFGAWAIGGPWKFGWSHQEESDSIAAIHESLLGGVNWIDTAAIYGLGQSEIVVAKALASWSGPKPYIFTKCGMIWDEQGKVGYSLKADSVRRECEASLRRLNVETIDLYQIHWSADDLNETEEGWSELVKLKQEGKVRWIGTSNFSAEELRAVGKIAPVTSLQPPYSLIKREIESEVLPQCLADKIGVIVYSPMASGLLTGAMTLERSLSLPADDWRRRNPEFSEPKLSKNLERVERLRKIGQAHGHSPGEVAIAWTLHHPAVTGAIVGGRKGEQVKGILGGADLRLTSEERAFIEAN